MGQAPVVARPRWRGVRHAVFAGVLVVAAVIGEVPLRWPPTVLLDRPPHQAGAASLGGAHPPEGAAAPDSRSPVHLAFGGDVHFEGTLAAVLRADPSTVLASMATVLRAADLSMVNLETAITDRGSPEPKEYTFRAPARALAALDLAGVDVASMANNHALDYGPLGVDDALAADADSDVSLVGIGRDSTQAYAPYLRVINGWRIAIIAATDVVDDPTWFAGPHRGGLASARDQDGLLAAVRTVRETADTVVVYLHWGVEGAACATARQRSLAQSLVAAGADVIVGGHSHRVGPVEHVGGALVAFDLGNLVFYAPPGPGAETGVLEVEVAGRSVLSYVWNPGTIIGGIPTALHGVAADDAMARIETPEQCAGSAH
jgi:hypothetical protein